MILVIGATGTAGRRVVAQLRTAGAAVRAGSRHPSSARPGEVEVVAADLADPGSLTPHLRDVRGVFLVWPSPSAESTARLASQVIEVLATSRRRIVYLSAAAAADDPGSFWALVERHVRRAGVPWTFLRPTGFAKNTLLWAPQIRSGDVVRWPYGRAARSLIHEDDIAAVAVRALTEGGHDQATYLLTGPEVLTQVEQVRIIGDVLGRDLRWEELPVEAARPQLRAAFGDAAFADHALATWSGFVDHPEPATATVQQVTGRPARSFRRWAADHADDFR